MTTDTNNTNPEVEANDSEPKSRPVEDVNEATESSPQPAEEAKSSDEVKNVKQLLADDSPHWYAIHTYSGYEDAVARNLKQRTESLNMEDRIFDVVVPKKSVVKVKRGKRVEEDEHIYPGYVLVKMIVTDDSWYVVRNTPRVTGFVGSGVHPVPLADEEVKDLFSKMKGGEAEHEIDLEVEDAVQVMDGPFKEMEGKVEEIDRERGKVKVLVSMFGRETPVELDFLQIRKV